MTEQKINIKILAPYKEKLLNFIYKKSRIIVASTSNQKYLVIIGNNKGYIILSDLSKTLLEDITSFILNNIEIGKRLFGKIYIGRESRYVVSINDWEMTIEIREYTTMFHHRFYIINDIIFSTEIGFYINNEELYELIKKLKEVLEND